MKKIILCMVVLMLSVSTFSQQTTSSQKMTKEDYLMKSKRQKTAGWVLLGGGAALILAGDLIGNSNEASFGDAGTGIIMAGLGVISMIVSIPVFLAATKNKRRGNNMTASLNFLNGRGLRIQGLNHKYYPALSVRIKL